MPRLALVVVTALWGSTFVVIHASLASVSPLVLLGSRCAVASAVLAVSLPSARRVLPRAIAGTVGAALALLAGMGLQTAGLGSTTPSRSAFLTALSVVLVPVLYVVWLRRWPRARWWLAAILALAGVYVLFRPIGLEWSRGDTLTTVSALAFAVYVIELGRISRRWPASVVVLAQTTTMAVLALALAPLVERPRLVPAAATLATIAYLGVICTAVTFLLMTWGQARLAPIEAAVIYTLEPVMAATFSIAFGREPIGLPLVAGGMLVVLAMLVAGGAPEPTESGGP